MKVQTDVKIDESGTITEGELRKIISSFNKPLSEEEIKMVLKHAKAKDGRIFYKDFIKVILTGKFEWADLMRLDWLW